MAAEWWWDLPILEELWYLLITFYNTVMSSTAAGAARQILPHRDRHYAVSRGEAASYGGVVSVYTELWLVFNSVGRVFINSTVSQVDKGSRAAGESEN